MADIVVVGRVHVIGVTGCSSRECWCLVALFFVLGNFDVIFVFVGIVDLFSGSVFSSGQFSCYQIPWLL